MDLIIQKDIACFIEEKETVVNNYQEKKYNDIDDVASDWLGKWNRGKDINISPLSRQNVNMGIPEQ